MFSWFSQMKSNHASVWKALISGSLMGVSDYVTQVSINLIEWKSSRRKNSITTETCNF